MCFIMISTVYTYEIYPNMEFKTLNAINDIEYMTNYPTIQLYSNINIEYTVL